MAAINGVMEHDVDNWASSAHLGKRKRSVSPDKKLDVNGENVSVLRQVLRRKLQLLSSSGPISSLLKHSLPPNETHLPQTKRARLSSATPEDETIEKRILSDFYTSYDQVGQDLSRLRDAIDSEKTEPQPCGDALDSSSPSNALREAASQLAEMLSSEETDNANYSSSSRRSGSIHRTGQVMTLRSQTEKGTQQLYSGLQIQDKATGTIRSVDGRRLPNGFDLTDPATMDTSILAPTKDRRLLGDVFRPHRGVKQLEMPRASRTTFRSNVLGFSLEPNLEKTTTINRHDYKFQQLPVSSWLNYNLSDQQSNRKLRGKSFGAGDLRAALIANDVAAQDSDDASTLFKKAFSSFAPTTDTSKAVVSEQDRDRQWWSRYGSRRLRHIFRAQEIGSDSKGVFEEERNVGHENFADVVSNFQSEEHEETPLEDDPETVDEVLTEISELLETLHSHQHIRNLDTRSAIGASKPSSAELDSYELLRSQLAILVASLPPFAVAKLDGNKLSDLNISTNILVDTVDYRGTAQPDEYTLSRYRAAQGTTTVAARPTQTATQPRPSYQTPSSMPRYNSSNSLSAYAQNLGIAAARYGQGTNYQTPSSIQRPYQQTPFQQSASNYSPQPTIQQFQRSLQNGYGSYSSASAQSQSAAGQTPSQPSHQQNAQNKMVYGNAAAPAVAGTRSASPTKPVVNGQAGYYGQQYQRPGQQQAQGGMVNGSPNSGS